MKKHQHRKKYKRKNRNQTSEPRVYSNVLTRMIDIYEPDDEDWMGFKVSSNNQYTFHHIRERRAGGKEEVENGAILTNFGHKFLNYLDSHYHHIYEQYQNIFRRINKSRGPIDDDLKEDIYGMMLDTFYYNDANIPQRELDYYDQFTRVKVKKK